MFRTLACLCLLSTFAYAQKSFLSSLFVFLFLFSIAVQAEENLLCPDPKLSYYEEKFERAESLFNKGSVIFWSGSGVTLASIVLYAMTSSERLALGIFLGPLMNLTGFSMQKYASNEMVEIANSATNNAPLPKEGNGAFFSFLGFSAVAIWLGNESPPPVLTFFTTLGMSISYVISWRATNRNGQEAIDSFYSYKLRLNPSFHETSTKEIAKGLQFALTF